MLHDYSVLVLVEPDFKFKAKDIDTYLTKLNSFLLKRAGDINLRVVTVEGKYGIPGVEVMPTDNRNKTAFIKAIEDYLGQLNEIVVIANYSKEAYLDAVSLKASEASKTFTVYGYETK